MNTTKYVSVSVPRDLIDRIEDLRSTGYVSVAEFVKDACRRRLEYLER